VVDSRFRTSINLISLSSFGGSDYFGINFTDIIKSDTGFDFSTDAEKFPSNANNFFLNVDVMGPSFMFNLTPKSSIGVVSRARAFLNINKINGQLYENIIQDFNLDENFNFNSENLNGTIHGWGEIGLVYGRILLNNNQNFIKGGITLKYLKGAGGLFMNSQGFSGQYTAIDQQLTTTGSLIYGISQDFDNENINFSSLTSGFGTDIGFTYEWRPNSIRDSINALNENKYKLKLAVSITDIGAINYKESNITTYNLNQTTNASTYDNFEDFLNDNYTYSERIDAVKIKLPTALHLLVDYKINKSFYLSFQSNLSILKNNTPNANSIINNTTISPRLETKYFSLYSPISYRQYGDLSWGAGFRISSFAIGSGSILSNLLSKSSKTTDIYVAGSINVFK
tara:strand:+ start:2327 stop:3517 length:1191 start_codon:yes stop_codon:yes gene_type:complete